MIRVFGIELHKRLTHMAVVLILMFLFKTETELGDIRTWIIQQITTTVWQN